MTDLRPPSLIESLGLRPWRERFRQAAVALRGAEDVPPSRFDASSLRMLNPRLAYPLWLGRWVVPRKVILTNLFNHRQTPVEEGWSVRRTQTEDFRGGNLTYDSHNGTDLSVPRGTLAVAPAAARVARVYAEFNRGGLKVVLDHGGGLLTCSVHLARTFVEEGDRLEPGQPYALTGYSGLDGFASFPHGVPHIHFNVWLDGEPVDPFPMPGEISLWRGGAPRPVPTEVDGEPLPPPDYDETRVDAAIASCRTASVRAELEVLVPLERRAAHLIAERCYYPTRFANRGNVYRNAHPRCERLYLPFRACDVDGVVFADEL
jgi:murein DD-endopeptidase